MNVALYYPWIYLKGGAERTISELVTRSRHQWTVYTNHFEPTATFPEFRELEVIELHPVSVRRNARSVVTAAWFIALQRLDVSGHDRAVVFSEGLGNLVARRLRIPATCVCLTPLKLAYDEVTNQRFLEDRPGLHYRAGLAAYRLIDRSTWRHYDRIFCISETVRQRLLAHRLAQADRIEVVYPGVDHDRFEPGGSSEHFFVLPGRIMWQKQIELALAAWRFFKPHPSDNDYRLLITGMVDRKSEPYLEFLQKMVAWRGDVEFVRSPSDDMLRDLYRQARAVLFTAPNEDFGLVPLEGMACGKPVIARGRGGPTETVIEGETGLLTTDDPRDYGAAMSRLATMDERQLALMQSEARSRALTFDWKHFVGRIDDHLDEPIDANAVFGG